MNWSFGRSYALQASDSGDYTQGTRWLNNPQDTYLYQAGSDIVLLAPGGIQRYFTASGSTFIAPTDSYLVFTHDSANKQYILTDQASSMQWTFHDFTVTNTALYGALKEQTTLQLISQGKSGFVHSYNADGTLNQVTGPSGQDYNIVYTWDTSFIRNIQYKDASGNVFAKVEYTYWEDVSGASADVGTSRNLVQVKVSRKATNDTGTTLSMVKYTQYRYQAGTLDTGYLLKAVYEHDAIQRILSTVSGVSTPENIITKADSYGTPQIQSFASRSFTYCTGSENTSNITTPFQANEDLNTRYGGVTRGTADSGIHTLSVATETINGCASCGGGSSIKKSYFYLSILNDRTDQNQVTQLVVEDTTDSGGTPVYRTIYALQGDNYALGVQGGGRLLRRVIIQDPVGSPKYWCESWKFATSTGSTALPYRVAEHRSPSAHTVVTSASALRQFLNPYNGTSWSNDTTTVNTSSGMIEVYSYNSAGFQSDAWIKNGSSGTAYYVSATDYGDTTNTTLVTAIYDYPMQTTTRSGGKQTSYSFTFYDSSTHKQIKTKTTTLPTISTGQNGSGVATTTTEYYDNLGRLRWTQDGEGYINYYAYHPSLGAQAYSAIDVNPASPGTDITSGSSGCWDSVTVAGASSNQPTRSSSLPTPLAIVSKIYYDNQGRRSKTIDAGGATHHLIYSDTEHILFPYWNSITGQCLMPIKVTKLSNGKGVTDSISVRASYAAISTTGGAPTGFSTAPTQSDYVDWTHYTYDPVSGLPTYTDQYRSIPSSGTGTLSTNFYRTAIKYDTLNRPEYSIQVIRGSSSNDRVEQVTRYAYDILNRVIQISSGVSGDQAANNQDMTDNYNSYPTLYTISQTAYDNDGVGDGLVTKERRFFGTSSTAYTGVNYQRTYRGHIRGEEPFYMSGSTETPAGPFSVLDVDWKGRATTSALFDADPTWSTVMSADGYSAYAATTSTHRRMQTDTLYDDLGRVYQSKKHEVSFSTGSSAGYISTRMFYDRNSRVVASGNDYAAGAEMAFDGAGRQYQSRIVLALQSTPYSSGVYNYCAPIPNPTVSAMSGGDAGVLAISHKVFDANGRVTEVDEFEDDHDDVSGTSIGVNLTNNNDYVRRTIFNWYDSAKRITTKADFGSGDASAGAGQWKYAGLPSRPSSAPTTSSNTALVTLYGYNADSGRQELVTAPSGMPTKIFYDRVGQVTYVAENYNDFNASTEAGAGDSSDKSKDKVTKKIYEGVGRLQQIIAMDPNADGNLADNQVTTYLFEDPVNAMRITSQIYPDSTDTTSSGTNQIKLAYNVDGSMSQRTDQLGTALAYTYTGNRMLANQSATTLGAGVDGTVRSIAYSYDNLNRSQNITSYASTGGTGSVVSDVQFEYNDSNQVITTYQSHSGAVNTSTSPKVQQTYDTTLTGSVFASQHRLQSIVYPDGRTVYYDYGNTATPAYNALSRVRTIRDTSLSGVALATYDYNGAGSRLAVTTFPEPSLKLNLWQGTSGVYAGLDRFGRVVDQYWQGFNATSDADRIHYGHDYSGARTYRDIDATIYPTNNHDQAYAYDALHRLTALQQGTLSGTTISGTPTNEEEWSLDGVNNWSSYQAKSTGATTLNQTRTVNMANEISGISASVGSTWATPAYDASGNMTTIPEPSSLTTGYTATYDAWNRLVQLVDATSNQAVQQNQYDGRNFRTVIKSYSSGTLSETRHSYFTDDWRCVEERVGSSSTADRQFVWGVRHIDDLVLRDRGTERLYALQDANSTVSAIVDETGVVRERFRYSGYGTPAFLSGSFGSLSSTTHAWETLFCGYRFDSTCGMYHVRNRIYHPNLGLWSQRDPLAYADGLNLYAAWFVPHTTDPLGLIQNFSGALENALSSLCDNCTPDCVNGCSRERCKREAGRIAKAEYNTFYNNYSKFEWLAQYFRKRSDDRVGGWLCDQWAWGFSGAFDAEFYGGISFEDFDLYLADIINDPDFPIKNSGSIDHGASQCFTTRVGVAEVPNEVDPTGKLHAWVEFSAKCATTGNVPNNGKVYLDDGFVARGGHRMVWINEEPIPNPDYSRIIYYDTFSDYMLTVGAGNFTVPLPFNSNNQAVNFDF